MNGKNILNKIANNSLIIISMYFLFTGKHDICVISLLTHIAIHTTNKK